VVQKWTRAVQDILLPLRVIPIEMNGPEVDPCGAPTFQFAQGVRFVLRFWCRGWRKAASHCNAISQSGARVPLFADV
jgi:hypothetical protein